jgi:hypothetical protein
MIPICCLIEDYPPLSVAIFLKKNLVRSFRFKREVEVTSSRIADFTLLSTFVLCVRLNVVSRHDCCPRRRYRSDSFGTFPVFPPEIDRMRRVVLVRSSL